MKKILVILLTLVVVVGYSFLNYHFILMDSGIKILKKADLSFENTIVDVRGTHKLNMLLNPALLKSGIKNMIDDDSITIGK